MKYLAAILDGKRPMVASLVGTLALMVGCSISDTPIPAPRVSTPEIFDQSSVADVPMTSADLAHWWTAWQDPMLNELIGAALDNNPDIRVAAANVREARSLVTVGSSALYPEVAAGGGVWGGGGDWRSRTTDLVPGLSPGVDARVVGLAASWEPDVFGGRNDDAEAARASALGFEARLRGARMIVAADVAANYLEARGLQRRLVVLDGSIAVVGQLLRYAEARFAAGQALAYDVDLVRERRESLQGKRPDLVSSLEMRQRRLMVLTGRTPETVLALSDAVLFTLPPAPAGSMPVDVLERRPDVQARAALVRAQTARLRSAKTDLLPRFQIQFLGQDGHLQFQGVPGFDGTSGLLGLTVKLPIFTAGRIQANIDANDARLDAAAAEYDKVVLVALEDVEDAYGVRHSLDQRAAYQSAALVTAGRNQQASTGLYEGGQKTLQDVLSAKLDALTREDELVQTEMGQASASVQLYRALGGGW